MSAPARGYVADARDQLAVNRPSSTFGLRDLCCCGSSLAGHGGCDPRNATRSQVVAWDGNADALNVTLLERLLTPFAAVNVSAHRISSPTDITFGHIAKLTGHLHLLPS